MADNRPIGVFDSGLGGLTVVKELKRILPNESIVYFGDTGRVPYGNRSPETIIKYARQDENFLLKQDVKVIVAACGTVSSVAVSTGKELPVPFFEVVSPAADAAVKATKSGRIGVIGTSATIKSRAHARRIFKTLPDAVLVANDCPLFVPLVEAGWIDRHDPVITETASRYLKPIAEAEVDVLILGCTHYPVLSDIIGDIMGKGVTLINTGAATAERVKEYLFDNNMNADEAGSANYQYFVSDRAESFSGIASILMGEDIEPFVEQVDIDNIGG